MKITSKDLIYIKKYGKLYNFSTLQQTSFPYDTDKNSHLKILASASSSEFTFDYNYILLCSRNRLWSHKLVLYIFVKNVILNKVGTLETCSFVTKCFAKISGKLFSDNLERASVENTCRETSVMEYFSKILHRLRQDLQL